MTRVRKTSFVVVLLSIFFSLTVYSGVSAANDYVVTITSSSVSHSQSVIFEELNIGPGFNGSYNVRVNNQSLESIGVNLFSVDESSANTLTMNELGMALSYNGQIITSNQPGSSDLTNHGSACIGPNTSELLMLHVWLDSSLGNEWQNRSFYADITFSTDSTKCEGVVSGGSQNPQLPELPNTGESRLLTYFFYALISLFTLLTIYFLVIFIFKRKQKDEEKSRHSSK